MINTAIEIVFRGCSLGFWFSVGTKTRTLAVHDQQFDEHHHERIPEIEQRLIENGSASHICEKLV